MGRKKQRKDENIDINSYSFEQDCEKSATEFMKGMFGILDNYTYSVHFILIVVIFLSLDLPHGINFVSPDLVKFPPAKLYMLIGFEKVVRQIMWDNIHYF